MNSLAKQSLQDCEERFEITQKSIIDGMIEAQQSGKKGYKTEWNRYPKNPDNEVQNTNAPKNEPYVLSYTDINQEKNRFTFGKRVKAPQGLDDDLELITNRYVNPVIVPGEFRGDSIQQMGIAGRNRVELGKMWKQTL